MKRLPVDAFLEGCSKGLLLDVRSPGEYNHAHLPGARNLPLFSDTERSVVGTAYKQESRETAIKIGLDYFGPKMRGMVEEVERISDSKFGASDSSEGEQPETKNSKSEIFLYCWRGGMRSGAVAWLLNLYGFNVTVLAGGYKAYRNQVLQHFLQPWPLQLLGGYTGSGKTTLLQELKTVGETVIDLEALASHKGSAFGNLGQPPQPSQEMFENLLSQELMKANKSGSFANPSFPLTGTGRIWLEDESQRIGSVNIPAAFWQTMRQSPLCFLDIPFETRLDNLVAEYGGFDRERLQAATERLARRLGGLETKNAIQHLASGDTRACFAILLRYYDKHYQKGLLNRSNLPALLKTVSCNAVSAHNATAVLQASQALLHV